MTLKTFGDRLLFLRNNILKIKRKDFCEKIGIPVITLRGWEMNTTKISDRLKLQLENALNQCGFDYDREWLFELNGEDFSPIKKSELKNNRSSMALNEYNNEENTKSIVIKNYSFDPLLTEGSVVTVKKVEYKDLKTPLMAIVFDADEMHFGYVEQTINKFFILNCYKGHNYHFLIQDSTPVYTVKKIENP
jgi:hypothetical protein